MEGNVYIMADISSPLNLVKSLAAKIYCHVSKLQQQNISCDGKKIIVSVAWQNLVGLSTF